VPAGPAQPAIESLKVSTHIYQFAQVIKVGWPSPVINGCRRRHHYSLIKVEANLNIIYSVI
jgi:hypothetical protein